MRTKRYEEQAFRVMPTPLPEIDERHVPHVPRDLLPQVALCATIASLAEWSIFPSIDRKIDQTRSLSG
jgi:hypothetical protein